MVIVNVCWMILRWMSRYPAITDPDWSQTIPAPQNRIWPQIWSKENTIHGWWLADPKRPCLGKACGPWPPGWCGSRRKMRKTYAQLFDRQLSESIAFGAKKRWRRLRLDCPCDLGALGFILEETLLMYASILMCPRNSASNRFWRLAWTVFWTGWCRCFKLIPFDPICGCSHRAHRWSDPTFRTRFLGRPGDARGMAGGCHDHRSRNAAASSSPQPRLDAMAMMQLSFLLYSPVMKCGTHQL